MIIDELYMLYAFNYDFLRPFVAGEIPYIMDNFKNSMDDKEQLNRRNRLSEKIKRECKKIINWIEEGKIILTLEIDKDTGLLLYDDFLTDEERENQREDNPFDYPEDQDNELNNNKIINSKSELDIENSAWKDLSLYNQARYSLFFLRGKRKL